MIYKQFGKTGKIVSVLGMGTTRLDPQDEDKSVEVLATAIESGINFFDVSPHYVSGMSERFMNMAMHRANRPVYVQTKSIVSDDPDADSLLRHIEKQLLILDLNKIPFYCMWNIDTKQRFDLVMKKDGPYEGAIKAKKEGLIEHITASFHCDEATIINALESDLFEGITISVNVLNYASYNRILLLAQSKGVGIITMNSLAGGLIPNKVEYFNKILAYGERDTAKHDEFSAITKCLRFNASLPAVTVVLSGMKTIEEVFQNCSAFETGTDNEPYTLSTPLKSMQLCTKCNYCITLSKCPNNIPISDYICAYNEVVFNYSGEEDKSKAAGLFRVLRDVSGIIPDSFDNPCVECGKCERICTQKLPIIERLRHIYFMARKYQYSREAILKRVQSCLDAANGKKIGITPAGLLTASFLHYVDKEFSSYKDRIDIFDSDPRKSGTTQNDIKIRHYGHISDEYGAILIVHPVLKDKIYDELKDCGVPLVKMYLDSDITWFGWWGHEYDK